MRTDRNRKRSSRGSFFLGFSLGVIFVMIAAVVGVWLVLKNPEPFVKKAVDFGFSRTVEKTVQSIPKSYVVEHQQKISGSVQRFIDAYSRNRISSDDIRFLNRHVIDMVSDQNITPSEIDDLLGLIEEISL